VRGFKTLISKLAGGPAGSAITAAALNIIPTMTIIIPICLQMFMIFFLSLTNGLMA